MLYLFIFILSGTVGAIFAANKKKKIEKIRLAKAKQEIQTLQKKFDREVDHLFSKIQKKNPQYSLNIEENDCFLRSTAEKYQINTDQALILYNKICFLRQKE